MKPGKKRVIDLLGFGVVVVWLGMMGLLVKRSYIDAPSPSPLTRAESSSLEEKESWMAIYQDDEKIGYSRSFVNKRPGGYTIREMAVMNLRAIGDVHRISTEILGNLAQDASLRSFVFILDSGPVRFEARGSVEGEYLVLNTTAGRETRKSRIALSERPVLSAGLWYGMSTKGLDVGARYRFNVFDPSIMAQRPVDLTVLAREELILDGGKWDAFKVKTTFAGMDIFTWIAPNGERLMEEGMMGLRLVKTTEEMALEGITSYPGTDLAEAVSIPSNKAIAEPYRLNLLRVRFDGIDPAGLDLNSGRQRLSGSVLAIALEAQDPEPLKEEIELGQYLKPGPLVQSDHPKIASLASKITQGLDEDKAKAVRILNWVHDSLEKRATLSVPNALETLEIRAGDCNEHAALFAALLRASGIPAKIVVGLVYARGRFYYHAWNEFFSKTWITADALMGQMPADATHIKFIEGDLDRQADMLRVIGKIKLTVLETE